MQNTRSQLITTYMLPAAIILLGCLVLGAVALTGMDSEETTAAVPTLSYSQQLRTEIAPRAAVIATFNAAPTLPPARVVAVPAADLGYAQETVSAGETLYGTVCIACHGPGAVGVANLGKSLADSEFTRGLTDQELLTFVKTGRPIWDAANTTGIDMPPKGGNPALTDDDILNIIAYLRTLDAKYVPPAAEAVAAGDNSQEEGQVMESDAATNIVTSADQPNTDPLIVQEAAPTAGEETAAHDHAHPAPAEAAPAGSGGEALFQASCSACHGADARGLPNHGKDLVAGEIVLDLTDEELLTFIKTGRPIWDAANTTGIDMPPKGGNPALSDDDILTIIAYLRSLQAGQ
jgi:mono/diheme cytochrome c family protein